MIAFLLKSAISMALLLCIFHLFLEREKMHRFNRFYLLGALLFSLLVPFITIPVYTVAGPLHAEAVIQQHIQQVNAVRPVAANATGTIHATAWLPYTLYALYGTVTLLLCLRFFMNINKLLHLKNSNPNITYKAATLVLINRPVSPYTFLKNIYINKVSYENGSIEPELFNHEMAHVQQRHTLDILFVEALRILLWFNPLLYFYKKAIQLNHEFLADENTIQKLNLNVAGYQQLLLQKTLPANPFILASNLNFSITKKRFTMMTKTTSKSKRIILKAAVVPTLAVLIYAISTKTVARQPQFQLPQNGPVLKDSASFKQQRDLYYSGVKVLIHDKANGIYINKPFEELTENEKWRYSFSLPEKGTTNLTHYPGDIYEMQITKIYKDGKVIAPAPGPVTEAEYYKGVRFIEYDKEGGKIILDKLYEELTPDEKKRFMPMMFVPKPLVKQSPTNAELKDFFNAEKYAIWIDGKNVPNSELKKYSPADIAYFSGSVILKNARTKKHPQPFQYWFYTHNYFDAHKMGEVKRHYGGDTITMWHQ